MCDGMELSEKTQMLNREGSLCSPDPHQQLRTAFRDRDLSTFQNILNQGTRDNYIDPNHWYEDPDNGTLLDLACRSDGNAQYTAALLQAGADVNKINRVHKKTPLHSLLAKGKDLQAFEVILNDAKTDPNLLDNKGNAPIHSAAELDNTEFIVKLLKHPKINVNLVNKKGQTALHIAAQKENKDAALLLIMAGVDLDSVKNVAGKTGRDLVLSNLPELKDHIPSENVTMENGSPNDLFSLLHRRDTERFLSAIRVQNKKDLDNCDGSHTYLQYACDFGLHKVVDTLLREGANPNATNPSNIRTPLMLAGRRGYVHIIRLFINNDATQYSAINDENVLHSVIHGIAEDQVPLGASRENRDHFKCLELLLKDVPRSKLDINCGDVKGNTPLHYAAKNGDPNVILLLLRHGAYVGQRNVLGQPAFADINPKILENYFDECLTTNDKLPREDNYEVIFKYNFLAPPKISMKSLASSQLTLHLESGQTDVAKTDKTVSETDPLLYMSRSPDFRPLLKHPILTSFIYLKWHRIRRYFYFNLTFYVIFWALLTSYILGFYGTEKSPVQNGSLGNNSRFKPDMFEDDMKESNFSEPLRALVTVFLLVLIAREIFQLAISPIKYVFNPENWLEIALIGVTISILFGNKTAQQQISAVAILLSWAELILLIGRHPANSTNIEMLKTVSWNFLKFLAWYSILIIAFALCFYTLFRDAEDSEDNFFLHPGMAIFKTVVMLTGEFDAGSIPFVTHPGVSHVLFVMFVFLIAIVLFNLLNGLAVSDTQAIRADAELVGYVSQVKLVSYIETMALGDPTPFKDLVAKMKTLCCILPNLECCSTQFGCLQMFSKKINLFSDLWPDYEIRVLPNQENRVETFGNGHRRKRQEMMEDDATCIERCSMIFMDPTIMKAAREILSRRVEDHMFQSNNKRDDERDKLLVEYGRRLDRYRDQLEGMKRSSEETRDMVQQLLALARHNKAVLDASSSDSDNQ